MPTLRDDLLNGEKIGAHCYRSADKGEISLYYQIVGNPWVHKGLTGYEIVMVERTCFDSRGLPLQPLRDPLSENGCNIVPLRTLFNDNRAPESFEPQETSSILKSSV